jgi:hypothetical protein
MKKNDNRAQPFSIQIRTTYADLLERLEDLNTGNAMASLTSCTLITKTVKRGKYLYAQGRLSDGSQRQTYLGPLDDRGKGLKGRFQQARRDAASEIAAIEMSAKALRAAGMASLDPVEWRVIAALAAEGVFRVGGVLIGTIAFRCISGLLGANLSSASAFTADVDLAGKTIPIAVHDEVASPQTALERLEMGFSPMNEFNPAHYGTRLKAGEGEFKVEFLTPLIGKDRGVALKIRQLGVPAIPLRFLDYLIENPVPAVALGRKPVLVKIPQPAHYAVHKLIVSRERKPSQRLKAQKDLQQSHELQQILRQLDPEALDEAFDSARSRGPGWKKRVDDGQKANDRLFRRAGDDQEFTSP